MNIAIHITHFYRPDREKYLLKVLEGIKTINEKVDVFIHSNKSLSYNANIHVHDLRGEHPYYLSWKYRPIMLEQRGKYDVYIYLEDDILFTNENLNYWKTYHDLCTKNDWYLGFLRKEQLGDSWVCTDIINPFSKKINIENKSFIINDINPYTGFWIADSNEFNSFSQKECFDLKQKAFGYDYRENAAIGHIPTFKGSIVLNEPGCFVHHLPNNYATDKNSQFGKIKCDDAFKLTKV